MKAMKVPLLLPVTPGVEMPVSRIVRYVALSWLLLHATSDSRNHPEVGRAAAFQPSPSSRIPSISTSRQRNHAWQLTAQRNQDDNDNHVDDDYDEFDAGDSANPSKKAAALTLAEMEDAEEARLAALEAEEAHSKKIEFVAPSHLYAEVTYRDWNGGDRIAATTASSSSSSSSSTTSLDSENSLYQTREKELQLAKERDILQNSRLNAMFREEDMATRKRQEQIQKLVEEDDRKWREERKKRMMGKYGEVKSVEELVGLMDEERREMQREMETKVNLAKAAGITLTLLEPVDKSDYSSMGDDSTAADGMINGSGKRDNTASSGKFSNDNDEKNTKSNFNPIIGDGKKSWFGSEDDIDLKTELQSLPQRDNENDDNINGSSANQNNNNNIYDRRNKNINNDDLHSEDLDEDGLPRVINGKLTSREQLMGISVGSAGGWSLEVFPGDFVVHRKYGIGRYEKTVLKSKTKLTPEETAASEERRKEIINGLMNEGKSLEEIQRVVAEFGTDKDKDPVSNPLAALLEIAYADAMVHVPIERAYRLSRYRAGDAAVKPRLSRVKGEAWAKAKRRVEANTVQMAEDVLALYATRETLNRPPFDPSAEGRVKKFAESFPYEPTPDQKKCFEDVENDMVWRSRPMDRLICGDVGFGKTEVAMRALFRCVANGRQAALLAPTGVLAAQHFKQVVRRMGEGTEHNFNVALLRGGMGKNTKKGRELRAAIASGEVDIVVGTHALLSNGMSFKDLGLLTIDEEQRFGVNQKERLKLICNCVDVLTLSATPIPRTLQMSLSGIRDTSTIRSPPPMRKPTISYVQEFDEMLIKDAIERELAREGQCFYVVPRISQLTEANEMLERIFPSLRVIQAHGRMSRGTAEDNVASFAEGNYDVLLATTVIENGVDIPRVNTIIIQNAQAFGMSTLYQLRGRVGRSDLQAYAYFFHKNDAITEQSAMRLQAMADLTELGSGFDVANRDLEIRGAGSLLGTEQSGMAAKVGFDLYMRMLKKSIRQLRGLDLPVVPRSNVLLPAGEGSIEAVTEVISEDETYLIPESYIPDAKERVRQEGAARLAESTQSLVEITNSWRETYGPLPAELQNNLKALHLHTCLRQLGIDVVGLDEFTGDCILRSPGLRPRHWAMICSQLPRGAPPKGLDVLFPARFSFSKDDTEITGGKKIDLEELLINPNYSDEEEEWDALDEEEVEAMKEISSAVNINSLSEIEVSNYPRFVVKKLGKSVKEGSRVDALLKVLLPPSKVVFEKQQRDKEKAKVAAELREKRELIAKQKKEQEKLGARRLGYTSY